MPNTVSVFAMGGLVAIFFSNFEQVFSVYLVNEFTLKRDQSIYLTILNGLKFFFRNRKKIQVLNNIDEAIVEYFYIDDVGTSEVEMQFLDRIRHLIRLTAYLHACQQADLVPGIFVNAQGSEL